MNLSNYILLSKEVRQSHIDLTSECILIPRTGTWTKYKNQMVEYLQLLDDIPIWRGLIHRCHACGNDTQKSLVCVNPLHLYLGTPTDNLQDRSPEQAQKGGLATKGTKRGEDFCHRNRHRLHKQVRADNINTGESVVFRSQKICSFVLGISPALVSMRVRDGLLVNSEIQLVKLTTS
jgi:hypothetical protein